MIVATLIGDPSSMAPVPLLIGTSIIDLFSTLQDLSSGFLFSFGADRNVSEAYLRTQIYSSPNIPGEGAVN